MFEAAEVDKSGPTEELEQLDLFLQQFATNNNDDDHTEPVEAEEPLVSLANNLTLEEALNLHQTLSAESPGTPFIQCQFSLNLYPEPEASAQELSAFANKPDEADNREPEDPLVSWVRQQKLHPEEEVIKIIPEAYQATTTEGFRGTYLGNK